MEHEEIKKVVEQTIKDDFEDNGVIRAMLKENDPVNHPKHYTDHPSGVECIQITEHMNFCIGNATKYLWRSDLKGKDIEDLEKAAWYLNRLTSKKS